MVRVDIKMYFAATMIMILLFQTLWYTQMGGLPVYFVDNSTRILLVKLTYFALLVVPIVTIMGTMTIWQSGAYLNRIIRIRHVETLLIRIYFQSLGIVLLPVMLLCLGDQLWIGHFYVSETLSLASAYAFILMIYLVLESRFDAGYAILLITFLILGAVLGSQQLKFLGPLVFQKTTSFWQVASLLVVVLFLFWWQSVQVRHQDYYGKE